jgi:hypothetical protein
MDYTLNNIDDILFDQSLDSSQKIDTLLFIDCDMYCNLGTDSTIGERNTVLKNSKKIYRLIKKIDPNIGDTFLRSIDIK